MSMYYQNNLEKKDTKQKPTKINKPNKKKKKTKKIIKKKKKKKILESQIKQ